MDTVPEAYYQFVMDYAPYVYVIPESGPDPTWGKAAFAAAFAIDFLFEAYLDPQFDDRSTEIEAKIVSLADWIPTQQCTDSNKQAYGGFKSTETSTEYHSVDTCRTIPVLLKAYELTSNVAYLNSATLAGGTFLYNMQHKPSQLGVHDRYYGGFARAATQTDTWLSQMDVECLYGIIALKLLCESDPANKDTYEAMIVDAAGFYRVGLEGCYLFYDPPPSGDVAWHRTGIDDNIVFDDSVAYALLGIYEYEGWSATVQKTYLFINGIDASPLYPAYNPAICWAGYINVTAKTSACDYYDSVTAGILSQIRRDHDKSACEFSVKIIRAHSSEFMFWGAKHADYSPVENKQAMATVCWLAQLFTGYEAPVTRFTQILNSKGENLTLYPVTEGGEHVAYGEGITVKAIVLPAKAEETLLEPGYVASEYFTLHVFAPVRCRVPGENALMQLTQNALEFGGGAAALDVYLKRIAAETFEVKAVRVQPAGDNVTELGSAEKRFKKLYLADMMLASDLNINKTSPAINLRTSDAIKATFGFDDVNAFLSAQSGDLVLSAATGVVRPYADATYDLGNASFSWSGLYVAGVGSLGWLSIGGYTVITNTRVLQNVTADAAIIASGRFAADRLPEGTGGYVLEAQGAGYDPMYVNPNGRYTPAGHVHAAGDITSGTIAETRLPSVYAGQVTFNGGIVTNSVNCANWQLADAIFANGFCITEAEKVGFGKGLAFLNPEGKALMVLTEAGDLHLIGKLEALKVKGG